MRNATIISGRLVRLVPYLRAHVPRYTGWMEDPELLRLTGSERLSLEQELENQESWHADPAKVTCMHAHTHRGSFER